MENTVSADTHVDVMVRINGSDRQLRLDSRVTLLDALRERCCRRDERVRMRRSASS
jgi:aerobic-type carbon monoxide dehydrogenase small subunit (CoxS/CutS family)